MKQLLPLVLLVILIFDHDPVRSENISVSGLVSGKWFSDTVKVYSDLTVPADSTLIIEAGTQVVFYGHYRVIVKGNILASGTPGQMIRFTINDTTGFTDTLTTAGGWHGFFYDHMLSTTDSSIFSYCIFEYGKAVSTTDTSGIYGGAFRIFTFGKIRFNGCRFENNLAYRWGGAVYAKYSNIIVENCNLISNRCGKATLPYGYGGALCFVQSSPIVINNYFEQNRSTGIGGGASFEYSDAIVRDNIFFQNKSGLGGAIGYMRSQPVNVVCDNLMEQNTAVFFGGAIACIRSNTTFVNNTIVNNNAMYGGGFYANDSAYPSIYNTIFYNDWAATGVEVYIFDVVSAPNFYYCNVPGGKEAFEGGGGQQGYHGEYVNNYDTDPVFSGTGPYPYELLPESPLVDAGTPDTTGLQIPLKDMAGNNRIHNGRIDVGAFEWDPDVGIRYPEKKNTMTASPNPCADQVTISIQSDDPEFIILTISDLNGNPVKRIYTGSFHQGKNSVVWDLTNESGTRVEQGIYICLVKGEKYRNSILIEIIP